MGDTSSLDKRVTKLEEIHSHQQHLIDQLNEVVVSLRLDLSNIKQKYEEQQARLKTLTANLSPIEDDDPNERPPHY